MTAAAKVEKVEYEFPAKDQLGYVLVHQHWRYKVLYGGRDSAKSHSIARALLIIGASRPLRVGCFREIQKDLDGSAYQLLKDLILILGFQDFYQCLRNEIRAPNGTKFMFDGLAGHNKDSIKSYEGIDVAWIEEANTISEGSWDVLEPTIRKKGSEIWCSFNPEMDDDYIYRLFVNDVKGILKVPTDAKVIKLNWQDNPWRSKSLDSRREQMQRDEPEKYLHVYEGHCKPAVEGAIYFKEVSRLKGDGRCHPLPYDPMLKVHVICDLGYNDYMSMLLVQRLSSDIRVIRYIEDRMRDIPSYSQELKDLKLNWGEVWLPHDARAVTLTSKSNPLGATAQEQFQNLGWTTQIVPNIPIDHGIQKCRAVFPRVRIDSNSASDLLNRLGRYRRRVVIGRDGKAQASTPMHDDESHGADGFRYMALVADQLTNDADDGWNKKLPYDSRGYV